MTDKEKLEKIKALADKMYSRMAYLTSDTRPIRKAMEEYHQFIINEYHKEEPVSNPIDFEKELYKSFGQVKDFTLGMRIAKWFYDMGKNSQEPVSEDLEEASRNYADNEEYGDDVYFAIKAAFKVGAKWQKEHLWKPADGDDLSDIDREVIAILDYDFGHYKVVYAHRPNPNGWNGTNIDTGEKEHFEPEIYDKGGWNQPHVLYWLDAKLPYEENKIDKE